MVHCKKTSEKLSKDGVHFNWLLCNIMQVMSYSWSSQHGICNGYRTEWSPIQSVILRVIDKIRQLHSRSLIQKKTGRTLEKCQNMVHCKKTSEKLSKDGVHFNWLLCNIMQVMSYSWSSQHGICNGYRTEWSPIQSVILRVIDKIRQLHSRSLIHSSWVWLQTKLDNTESYYHLIIKIEISVKRRIAKLWKKAKICIKRLTKKAGVVF